MIGQFRWVFLLLLNYDNNVKPLESHPFWCSPETVNFLFGITNIGTYIHYILLLISNWDLIKEAFRTEFMNLVFASQRLRVKFLCSHNSLKGMVYDKSGNFHLLLCAGGRDAGSCKWGWSNTNPWWYILVDLTCRM